MPQYVELGGLREHPNDPAGGVRDHATRYTARRPYRSVSVDDAALVRLLATPGDLQLILEKLADNDIEIDHLIRRHAA